MATAILQHLTLIASHFVRWSLKTFPSPNLVQLTDRASFSNRAGDDNEQTILVSRETAGPTKSSIVYHSGEEKSHFQKIISYFCRLTDNTKGWPRLVSLHNNPRVIWRR